MSSSARVHTTETLNVTQAEYIHDLAKVAKNGLQELYSRWYVLGASLIDVVVRVGSLGACSSPCGMFNAHTRMTTAFFTAIAIGEAYSVLYVVQSSTRGSRGPHLGLVIARDRRGARIETASRSSCSPSLLCGGSPRPHPLSPCFPKLCGGTTVWRAI